MVDTARPYRVREAFGRGSGCEGASRAFRARAATGDDRCRLLSAVVIRPEWRADREKQYPWQRC
jgi:hypothetical protein